MSPEQTAAYYRTCTTITGKHGRQYVVLVIICEVYEPI